MICQLLCSMVAAGPVSLEVSEPGRWIRAAAVFDSHLLCLHHGGTFRAWELKTGSYKEDVSTTFFHRGLTALAADGEKLWAADESTMYRWSKKERTWEKAAAFDGGKESLVEIVMVGGSPLLVFPSKVIDPIGKRTFKVPEIKAPL